MEKENQNWLVTLKLYRQLDVPKLPEWAFCEVHFKYFHTYIPIALSPTLPERTLRGVQFKTPTYLPIPIALFPNLLK